MTNYDGNLTPHQRLQKNMLALITHKHYRSLGGIIMSGEARVDETGEVPTAATDGFNVIYSKAFISSMPDPELRFVILHENLHKALRHLSTWYTMWQEDPGTANAACDYVINLMIMRSCGWLSRHAQDRGASR
jgi:predicted metal-dependent peptidase